MASNALPSKRDPLFALCDDLCDGLHALETTVGVKQNTESILRPALAAARGSEAAFGDAQVARKDAYATLSVADDAGRTFIGNARKRLAKIFGELYSTEWGAAGWPGNSTGMPASQDERLSLINALKLHFTSHPEHESADMEATATIAETTYTALMTARTLVASRLTAAGTMKNARDVAEANLRKRANGLIWELETLLGPDDPRWHSFGLNRPADPELPEAPDFTTVTSAGPGTLLVDWNPALRANHYRVWKQQVGVDESFVAVQSPQDTDATLTGLPTGATIKVRATAVNNAGESAPGPEAEAVVI